MENTIQSQLQSNEVFELFLKGKVPEAVSSLWIAFSYTECGGKKQRN